MEGSNLWLLHSSPIIDEVLEIIMVGGVFCQEIYRICTIGAIHFDQRLLSSLGTDEQCNCGILPSRRCIPQSFRFDSSAFLPGFFILNSQYLLFFFHDCPLVVCSPSLQKGLVVCTTLLVLLESRQSHR